VRNSWGSNALTALVVGAATLAETPALAHRRDEYLQAARIAIDPQRVQIDLDLTPGIAVASRLLDEIDHDKNGVVSGSEARAYATRVIGDIRVDVDGETLPLSLASTRVPTVESVLRGEGTIQFQLTAAVRPLAAGDHRLSYRNAHHQEIGAYLANTLAPATDRVMVLTQHRDAAQRELVVEYVLRDPLMANASPWTIAIVGVAFTLLAAELWRRSRKLAARQEL
jgi:hypothetical protein